VGDLLRGLWRGVAAGAAGTTALDTVTYLDMVVRGRPASSAPEKTVEALSDRASVTVPGDGEEHDDRVAGLGALTGVLAGLGTGALLGLTRAAGLRPGLVGTGIAATALALIGTNAPMTVLGVTDPRTWPVEDWIADIVPHVAYGFVVAAVLTDLDPSDA
jgi:hypothetical protein